MQYLKGLDRAEPWTEEEVQWCNANGFAVLGYYLPSPHAAVSYTLAQARTAARARFVLPIFVPPLDLPECATCAYVAGEGAGGKAFGYLTDGYPHSGKVALDIEAESSGNVKAYASGWLAGMVGTVGGKAVRGIVYGSPLPQRGYEGALSAMVPASAFWSADAAYADVHLRLSHELKPAHAVGWQWAINSTLYGAPLGAVDVSTWQTN